MGNIFWDFLYILVVVLGISGRNITNPTTAKPTSSLLSKFHQNDYKLVYERSELARSDASLVKAEIRTFKFNRTTPVINGSFVYTFDAGYKMEVIVQVYRFASNEYREFPIRFQLNFCEILNSKAFGLNKISDVNGNIVCPLVQVKKYYLYNFAPDGSQFPPSIPNGRYMLELQFLYQPKEVFSVNSYGIVDRPIVVLSF